ncbi:MAG: hypothetical protein V9G29_04425 [Burkholderiaceae bacterium]
MTALHYSPRDPRLVVRVAIANPDGSTDERFAWWAPRHLPAPARARAPWVAPAPGTLLATDVARAGCLGAREADDAMFVLLQTADCTSEACTRTAEVVGLGGGAAALGGRPVRVASGHRAARAGRRGARRGRRRRGAGQGQRGARGRGAGLRGDARQRQPRARHRRDEGRHVGRRRRAGAALGARRGVARLRAQGGRDRGRLGSHPKLRMAYVRSAQAGESRYEDRVSAVPLAKTFFHKNAADVAEEERQRAAAADASARAQSDMAAAIERAKAVAEEEKRQAAERGPSARRPRGPNARRATRLRGPSARRATRLRGPSARRAPGGRRQGRGRAGGARGARQGGRRQGRGRARPPAGAAARCPRGARQGHQGHRRAAPRGLVERRVPLPRLVDRRADGLRRSLVLERAQRRGRPVPHHQGRQLQARHPREGRGPVEAHVGGRRS